MSNELRIRVKPIIKEKLFKFKEEASEEKANREGKDLSRDFLHTHDRMLWHNEIRELLDELHTNKYDFYRLLRNYM